MAEVVQGAEQGEDLLSVTDLVRMFEEAEESTLTPRKLSERDRDYYDNKQLTDDELKTLKKRGQPPVIDNRIKSKIDFLLGLEKQQRVVPKALPRTPVHEADADGATQALRYVTDAEGYSNKRSGVWKNLLIEGSGGIAVSVKPSKYNGHTSINGAANGSTALTPITPTSFDVELRRIAWDRMFADPASSEADYSDANYLGVVVWMDYTDALAQYHDTPDIKNILEVTLQSVTASQTYDDKPKFNLWADRKRKRVRIVQMWVKRDHEWYFAEFTKGGILKAGPSPFKTDTGESDCELIFQSAYVDRDNNRYGLVREMISPQDEVNKRRSKALHLLNVAQIVMTEGALGADNDIEKVRKEAAKPDAVIILADGNGPIAEKFQFNTRTDLAAAQLGLLQDSKNAIDLKGPNATMMGDKTGGSQSASGKAIIASQQGGMMQLGDLLDNLRHLDQRVFRAIWNRIRQYWTSEKWLRVTDDERNVKWVGINVDRGQLQAAMAQNPEMGKKIAGAIGSVAELDCDIIIDEAPDTLAPQLEQFQALVELKKYDAENEIPFRDIVAAAPNLKNKEALLAAMDKRKEPNPQKQQMQQAAEQLQFRGVAAKVADTEASAELKRANAAKAAREAMAPPDGGQQQPLEAEQPLEFEQALADLQNTVADTELKRANTGRAVAQTHAAQTSTALAPLELMARAQPPARPGPQQAA